MKINYLDRPQRRAPENVRKHHPANPVPPKRTESQRKPELNAAEEYRLAQLKKRYEEKFGKGSWPKGMSRFQPRPALVPPVHRPKQPVEFQPRRPVRPAAAPQPAPKSTSPDKGIYATVNGKKVKIVPQKEPHKLQQPYMHRTPFDNPRKWPFPPERRFNELKKEKEFHYPKPQEATDTNVCKTIRDPKIIEYFCKKYPQEACCEEYLKANKDK